MWKALGELDRILRGEATRPDDLRQGQIDAPAERITPVLLMLAMVYGACMGCFALFREDGPVFIQLLATTLKVPALFFLTLLVTFPSLYVFNALVGSQLRIVSILRLLVASLAVNVAVLASFGPIVAFFAVCTTSYPFMVLLNVLFFTVAGLLGLSFLLQTLNRLSMARHPARWPSVPAMPAEPVAGEVPIEVIAEPGPLDRVEGHVLGHHVKKVFACWVVIFGLVGAQMGWVLRPFIGSPGQEFEWFRARGSNFFEAVWNALRSLLLG